MILLRSLAVLVSGLAASLVVFLVGPAVGVGAEPFSVEQFEGGVRVKYQGELFAEYRTDLGPKPIVWPIIGPTGAKMTRNYPLADPLPAERRDHVHHRSLWLTHGNVNGVDFWSEKGNSGRIKHQKYLRVQGGEQAIIETLNAWTTAEGKTVCQDRRRLTFRATESQRMIDFDVTIIASEGPVTFGDTKEGTFGVRVAGSMKVDAKPGGQITTSKGATGREAWGKPASWVDYHGPVEGKECGLAILNHPSSFRYPSHWHVRTYGLFAANPFGYKAFKSQVASNGTHQMKQGESFSLFYRVLLHGGAHSTKRMEQAFSKYAALKKTPLSD